MNSISKRSPRAVPFGGRHGFRSISVRPAHFYLQQITSSPVQLPARLARTTRPTNTRTVRGAPRNDPTCAIARLAKGQTDHAGGRGEPRAPLHSCHAAMQRPHVMPCSCGSSVMPDASWQACSRGLNHAVWAWRMRQQAAIVLGHLAHACDACWQYAALMLASKQLHPVSCDHMRTPSRPCWRA